MAVEIVYIRYRRIMGTTEIWGENVPPRQSIEKLYWIHFVGQSVSQSPSCLSKYPIITEEFSSNLAHVLFLYFTESNRESKRHK